ncbi:uncharacterized protein [Rhodnius prolixus]|uniref:uncharacterized protein n=1 Tax=Rhodnius prolixus TaxID=13249 RepID=UPI003D188971
MEAVKVSIWFVTSIISLLQPSSCLECYHCSGKIAADCRDPFPPESNATGLVNCSTLRTRGLNVLNIYNSLLQNVTAFKALGPEPHVCYKLYDGETPVRGCSRRDFCQNYTSNICETCETDGCNLAQHVHNCSHLFLVFLITIYLLHFY